MRIVKPVKVIQNLPVSTPSEQETEKTVHILPGTPTSRFDCIIKQIQAIKSYEDFLKLLYEVLIRFDTDPKLYSKHDFFKLIITFSSALRDLYSEVKEECEQIEILKKELAELTLKEFQDVESLNNKIQSLITRISSDEANIELHTSQISNLNQQVTSLKQKVDKHEQDLNKLDTSVKTINNRVSDLEQWKEGVDQDIVNLDERLLNAEVYLEDLDVQKQDKLISGENIKTINGQSVLGNGNITIKETYPHVFLTEAQWAALTEKDKNTIYCIFEDEDPEEGWVFGNTFPIIFSGSKSFIFGDTFPIIFS